jgi:hypothetical protein
MSSPEQAPYLLIIANPPNALDTKALEVLQSASDTVKRMIMVAESNSMATPVIQNNRGARPIRTGPGMPALEELGKITASLPSAPGGDKQASQAEQRKRLLESFMSGATRQPPRPPGASTQRITTYPPTHPSSTTSTMPAAAYLTPTTSAPPTDYSRSVGLPDTHAAVPPPDLVYFGGNSGQFGSLGTPISDMFLPKELQPTDIVPRDPSQEVLSMMRARTADVLMNQFGALDQRTDVPSDTQIDDRAKGGASESTMNVGR